MTILEQIDFDNEEKFFKALSAVINGDDKFRSAKNKEGENFKRKIISKNKLWIGNYAINISKGANGKIYCGVAYHSFDDRMAILKYNKENKSTSNTSEV